MINSDGTIDPNNMKQANRPAARNETRYDMNLQKEKLSLTFQFNPKWWPAIFTGGEWMH